MIVLISSNMATIKQIAYLQMLNRKWNLKLSEEWLEKKTLEKLSDSQMSDIIKLALAEEMEPLEISLGNNFLAK